MLGFIIGFLLGGVVGISIMCAADLIDKIDELSIMIDDNYEEFNQDTYDLVYLYDDEMEE